MTCKSPASQAKRFPITTKISFERRNIFIASRLKIHRGSLVLRLIKNLRGAIMKNADIFVSRVWKAAILAAIMVFMFGRNPGFALTVSTDGSTITPSSGGSLETADG